MKSTVLFLVVCLLNIQAVDAQLSVEKVLVEGGEMIYKDTKVSIESLEIGKFEITNNDFALFLNSEKIGSDGIYKEKQLINISSDDLQIEFKNGEWVPKAGKKQHPMVMVGYYGAYEYCKWIGGNLPTVEEWTWAAKGGNRSKNYIYSGSNNLDEVGWYRGNCGGHSHQVGKKKPNELGIYDMSGNAWEWCLNPNLKSDEDFCVHMGGSWYPDEEPSRISSYFGNTPTHFSNSVGFRVIFSVK
jgi:formylglycine-generating enzyme required for sulfatase activity